MSYLLVVVRLVPMSVDRILLRGGHFMRWMALLGLLFVAQAAHANAVLSPSVAHATAYVEAAMADSGVPGYALAIVHDGEVVSVKGADIHAAFP